MVVNFGVLLAVAGLAVFHSLEPGHAWPVAGIWALNQDHPWRSSIESGLMLSLGHALAARDRGSARQALDLLLYAGEVASRNGEAHISEEHVETAQTELEQERVTEGMHELTRHGHLTLLAVVALASENATPARCQEIFQRYTTICEYSAIDPLQRRSIQNHLSDLGMLGILTATENRTGSRENYYEYELDVPRPAAIEALDQELYLAEYIQQIR